MPSYKQAVSHWTIGGLSDDQYKQIFELGITGIEMPPADRYSKFLDLGFSIASQVGHGTLEDGLNKKENHSRIADEIRAALEDAKKYSIPNLICFSGNRDGKSEQEGAENTAEGLSLVAKDAESAGVNLIVELLNSKVDHIGYQCDTTSWGVGVCKAVNSPRVKLLYDIYHLQIMEGDLIRTIRDNIDFLAHFHTAGNPGRNNLDENQEIYYPAIARNLNELGYTGWVGHEFMVKGDPIAAFRQAVEQFAV